MWFYSGLAKLLVSHSALKVSYPHLVCCWDSGFVGSLWYWPRSVVATHLDPNPVLDLYVLQVHPIAVVYSEGFQQAWM
jgi:hypothetical protein